MDCSKTYHSAVTRLQFMANHPHNGWFCNRLCAWHVQRRVSRKAHPRIWTHGTDTFPVLRRGVPIRWSLLLRLGTTTFRALTMTTHRVRLDGGEHRPHNIVHKGGRPIEIDGPGSWDSFSEWRTRKRTVQSICLAIAGRIQLNGHENERTEDQSGEARYVIFTTSTEKVVAGHGNNPSI